MRPRCLSLCLQQPRLTISTSRRGDEQRQQLEHELEEIGIRLNRTAPDLVFKPKTAGGITINSTVPLTRTDERTIRGILQSYKVRLGCSSSSSWPRTRD